MKRLTLSGKTVLLSTLLIIFGVTGCDRLPFFKKHSEIRKDAVAVVGEEEISASELWWYLDSRSSGGLPIVDEEGVESRLKEMVTTKLFAQEARKQKFGEDPSIRYAIDQMLGLRLLDQQVVQPTMNREISDQEIEAYFKEHESEYSRPKQVRLADIYIAVSDNDSPEQLQETKKKAEIILQQAIQSEGERFGFSKLVKDYSNQHPAYSIGDTGYFDVQGKPGNLDTELVEMAFQLEEKGTVHEALVETSDGYHIVMLVGSRASVTTDLEKVRPQLEQRIRREEVKEKREALIKSLTDSSSLNVVEKELIRVTADYLQENSKRQKAEDNKGFQLPTN